MEIYGVALLCSGDDLAIPPELRYYLLNHLTDVGCD
jgi:hypothetical protein